MEVWTGRVFGRGERGGSPTGVVTDEVPAGRRQEVATRLGLTDTAFVLQRATTADGRPEVVVRTHSPVEEVAHCLQTSLAVPVALGAGPGEVWRVVHEAGDAVDVGVGTGPLLWAAPLVPSVPAPHDAVTLPAALAGPAGTRTGVVVRSARPRLHVTGLAAQQLEDFAAEPSEVLHWCAALGVRGVALSGVPDGGAVRLRVFTTSLAGREDTATGGAALQLGHLLRSTLVDGDLVVTQGSAPASGHLHLHLPAGAPAPHLGAEVRPG